MIANSNAPSGKDYLIRLDYGVGSTYYVKLSCWEDYTTWVGLHGGSVDLGRGFNFVNFRDFFVYQRRPYNSEKA